MQKIKEKLIKVFVIFLLTAHTGFATETLSQTKPEYWIKEIETQKYFEPKIKVFSDLLEKGPSLAESQDAVMALTEAIKKNPPALKSLILHGYSGGMTREFEKFLFEKVLDAVPHNITLSSLNLEAIPQGLVKLIVNILKENKTLETLLLRGTSFTEEEALEIAKGLRENTTLKKVDLRGFYTMTLKGKEALREAENSRDKKNPLIVLLPDVPDEFLNKNRGLS